ncbi:MAG TPA: spore germination protein, partial [Candidatus Angelobacter sp.]|nr:spore germination protein [Candidatus Angelobacter sp.]
MHKLNEVIDTLKKQFQESKDLIVHSFDYYNQQIYLVFLQNVCDADTIKKDILQPLMMCEKESKFVLHLLSLTDTKTIQNNEDLQRLLIDGNVLIFLSNTIYSYRAIHILNNQPEDASVEMSVQGPQKALSQDLNTNIGLIRHRYPSSKLKIDYDTVGTLSKTKIALVYDVDYADQSVIKDLKKRLKKVKIDVIQAASQLDNALTEGEIHLFPTTMITERPDRIALNLSQGKVVIVIDGTPFSLTLPAVFFDFISSMDDLYHSFWVKKLLVVIRYFALVVT